ncbi:TSUP family transporter [Exiguobacterium sp. SL14]|nr:TSUP family transporter [Exiguobacterium sp. SL14]MCY1692383.1 TSUP family transporter [Exiguobacterium sp. SL14]
MYILFILLGAIIGILSGFFGIGGGIILTPLLLILGYEASTAIVLSLLLTLGSTITEYTLASSLKNIPFSRCWNYWSVRDHWFCVNHTSRLLARASCWC